MQVKSFMATTIMLSKASVDCNLSIRIACDHQNSVVTGTQSLHNHADFEPDPVRENPIESTTCETRLHRRTGQSSYPIEFIR